MLLLALLTFKRKDSLMAADDQTTLSFEIQDQDYKKPINHKEHAVIQAATNGHGRKAIVIRTTKS